MSSVINLKERYVRKLINRGLWGLIPKEGSDAIEPLIEFMLDDSKSNDDRNKACEALGTLKPASIKPLASRLNNHDPEVRCIIIRLLSGFTHPDCYDHFIEALDDEEALVRKHAIGGIIRLRDTRANPAIKEMLKDSDREVGLAAYYALNIINSRRPRPGDPLIDLAHLFYED